MSKSPNRPIDLDALRTVLSDTNEGVAIQIKAVPGSSRTRLAGLLGDRLKVSVSAPPEGGRANRAVCELFANLLHVSRRSVIVQIGQNQPFKTIEVLGVSLCNLTERLRTLLNEGH